jgi:hypothetical protein
VDVVSLTTAESQRRFCGARANASASLPALETRPLSPHLLSSASPDPFGWSIRGGSHISDGLGGDHGCTVRNRCAKRARRKREKKQRKPRPLGYLNSVSFSCGYRLVLSAKGIEMA